jgi:F1F0 ATPase subunit 2
MNELFAMVLVLVAGAFLGTFFFGGLWWTVRKGLTSNNPALWFFGSTLLRTGIALAGFYIIARGDWTRILVCLLGFLIARFAVVQVTRPATEGSHAP